MTERQPDPYFVHGAEQFIASASFLRSPHIPEGMKEYHRIKIAKDISVLDFMSYYGITESQLYEMSNEELVALCQLIPGE